MKMKRKKWKKPELVVLVRSTPAENILTSDCKFNGLETGGDVQTVDGHGCQARVGGCGACSGLGGSGS